MVLRRSAMVMAWLAVTTASAASTASTVTGQVFADVNGDGQPSPGEPGQAGAVVAFDDTMFTTTDAQGNFALDVPDGVEGELWGSVPSGFAPGPVWKEVRRGDNAQHGLSDERVRELPAQAASDAVGAPLLLQTVLLEPDDERSPRNPEQLRGARAVRARMGHRRPHDVALVETHAVAQCLRAERDRRE